MFQINNKFWAHVIGIVIIFATFSSHASNEGRGGRGAPRAVRIQFNNYGDGVDSKSSKKILSLIAKNVIQRNVSVMRDYTWGSQGEFTVCVEFHQLSEVDIFINSLKPIVDQSNKNSENPMTLTQVIRECDSLAMDPVNVRGQTISVLLIDSWSRSHELDGSDAEVYRSSSFKLPPSRGREGIQFKNDGRFTKYTIAKGDGSDTIEGSWKFISDDIIQLDFLDSKYPSYRIQVVSIDDTMLRLRRFQD